MDIKISTAPTIKASTCDVDGNIDIKMPNIGLNRLLEVGSVAGRTPFNIGMNCDPSISVHMVMTDAQNPGNTSNVLSLSPGSDATGVGYQILRDNSPINLGPASSIAGALNQFKVLSSTGSAGGRYLIPFYIQYQRTASSKPGSGTANANAVFTMSYQ
ncbi:fimbrial protein [Pseudomonas sp. W4I3]|uniref:fimbrial protein n=1 Tax=Pseudomonas sp. W4I3 TaxID=3042294 RepID=UPI00277F5BBA|nr:fimbrial protein [Pseudomonas sp. W4I3]MDQ0741080.1 type 1 fimbria pilin [Pseudomonas sp. W4I3]